MKKIFLLIAIIFIFINLFAVSAQDNETIIGETSGIAPDTCMEGETLDNGTPAVSIETSISNKTIYIGNQTEASVTVRNVGNCDINDLRIINILSLSSIEYIENYGFMGIYVFFENDAPQNSMHFNSLESINASWNYRIVNDSADELYRYYDECIVFNLTEPLKVNQSHSFKVIYNTTKDEFYNFDNIHFFVFSNSTMLNSTFNKINITQIPRTVHINRKIENGSLIVSANVSSLDNSVFSGELYVKVADRLFSPSFPKEEFESAVIEFSNNTGSTSMKLPLEIYDVYPTGLIPVGYELYPIYAYKFVYDEFDSMLVQPEYLGTHDLVKMYKNDSQFIVDIPELSCKNVTFKINGVSYVRNVTESGFAKLNINLNPGVYTIESSIRNYKFNNTVTVLPTIITEDLVKYYRNGSQFYVKLVDFKNESVASQNLTFNINGVFYSRQTNEDGIAKLNINLNPGKYIITVLDPLTGLKMSYNITVLSKLYGEDIISFKDGFYYYSAELVDDMGHALSGESISFNIGGMILNNITDAKGEAKLFINLMPGQYIVTAQYLSSKISNIITIIEK